MWVLGIELRTPGLCSKLLPHCAFPGPYFLILQDMPISRIELGKWNGLYLILFTFLCALGVLPLCEDQTLSERDVPHPCHLSDAIRVRPDQS